MTLTPEQIAKGWRLHDGSDVCPIKDDRTTHRVMFRRHVVSELCESASAFRWEHHDNPADIIAYRIIEAHGADAEPARPTPFPASYDDLVFDPVTGWSQTVVVDGKRPEWLRDDDRCNLFCSRAMDWPGRGFCDQVAIRVRRREPKRETVRGVLTCQGNFWRVSYDLIDGKPDLSTLKIAEGAA